MQVPHSSLSGSAPFDQNILDLFDNMISNSQEEMKHVSSQHQDTRQSRGSQAQSMSASYSASASQDSQTPKSSLAQSTNQVDQLAQTQLSSSKFQKAWDACQTALTTKNWEVISAKKSSLESLINEKELSLLLAALDKKEFTLAEELIRHKICLHTRDPQGNTAMHYAMKGGNRALIDLLNRSLESEDKESGSKEVPFEYSLAFSKTKRAIAVQRIIQSKEFDKILPLLCSLSLKGRLNYKKQGETLFTFSLKFALKNLEPKDIFKLIEQFHLAGTDFTQGDGEGVSFLRIVQASTLPSKVKKEMLLLLQALSSEGFTVSAEYSNSKKAKTLQKYIKDANFKGLNAYLIGLKKEGKLAYVKSGETLLNHFLKGSIHSCKSAEVLAVIDAFHSVGYSFNFSDTQGNFPLHIVIRSAIPIGDKKEIVGRLLQYGASCDQQAFKGTTLLQIVIENLTSDTARTEWLDLLLYLLKHGANPNYGNSHPLTQILVSPLDAAIKLRLVTAFLETNFDETARGSSADSQTPLAAAMAELTSAKSDQEFDKVFQYAFPLIMRNIGNPAKQSLLTSLIRQAYETDQGKGNKILNAIHPKISEESHYHLFKIMQPIADKSWMESFFRNSKSKLVINELAQLCQLAPEFFLAWRDHKCFSDEKVRSNLRQVNSDRNLLHLQKAQIGQFILKNNITDIAFVKTLLLNIESLKNIFGDNFRSKLITFLVKLNLEARSLIFLNGILNKLTDLDPLETREFSTQDEIFKVLSSDSSDWIIKLDNLTARIYHAKYPEKPLEEVLANFRKMGVRLSDQELQELGNCYQQILQYSLEKRIQNYSPTEIANGLRTLSNYPGSEKSNYDRFTVCMALIRQAIFKTEGYLPYNTQVLVVLALIKYKEKVQLRDFIQSAGKGRLAQVNTGQGKSIIVAMTAAHYGLIGKVVDVVNPSDSLAIRDAQGKAAFFKMLGLVVKHNCLEEQTNEACYKDAHIVYGTPFRFESAILDDLYSDKITRGDRKSQVVIVDEVDSMFLDKGSHSTRLIYPDSRFNGLFWVYYEILECVKADKDVAVETVKDALLRSEYYSYSTEFVKEKIETNISSLVDSAKTALHQYAENMHYVKKKKEILPVDFKHTGALEDRTRYNKGLHQFLEIKHKLVPKAERSMGCCISHVSFFLRYETILGLSGSLGADAERSELRETFNLDTFDVPPHIEGKRIRHKPIFTNNKQEWFETIKADALKQASQGRAVLILFETIQQTLDFQAYLNYGKSALLNGNQSFSEEEHIVTMAGNSQIVTIATNKAGRGMDIRTTPQTEAAGGLHVILGFFPLNIRVQKQAEGRTARIGKDGTVQMILNSSFEEAGEDGEMSIEALERNRSVNEVLRSKERIEVVIPMAKHIDSLVLDFCSRLPAIKRKYNKHEVKAFRERWAEWLSELDGEGVGGESLENWKRSTTLRYNALIESLLKSLEAGTIIQNPDIWVSWGDELTGMPAIEKYTQAIRLDPGQAKAYLQLGFEYKVIDAAISKRHFTKAVLHYSIYIKLNPTESEYFTNRGRALNELQQHARALEDFSNALVIDSGNTTAFLGRAKALGALNKWDDAIRDYKNLIKQGRSNDFTDEGRATLFAQAALGLQEAQQYRDALSIALEALNLPIKNIDRLVNLNIRVAKLYTDHLQNAKQGVIYYQRVVDLKPQDEDFRNMAGEAYFNLGIDYVAESNWREALVQYLQAEKLVVKNPKFMARICQGVGECYENLGNIPQAIAYYKRAMQCDPTNINPKECLAGLYITQGSKADDNNQMNEAIRYYKLAEEITTGQVNLYNLYNNFGVSYKKLGQFGTAIAYYEAAIKQDPTRDLAKENLAGLYINISGTILKADGDANKVIDYCNKALALDLTNASTKCTLFNLAGLARRDLKQYDRAIANYKEAIKQDPTDNDPKTNLARLYLTLADAADNRNDIKGAVLNYMLGLQVGTLDTQVLSILNNDLGVLYRKVGMDDESIPYFEAAIRLNDFKTAHVNLAAVYMNKGVEFFNNGSKHMARLWYQRAQQHDPGNALLRANIRLTYS